MRANLPSNGAREASCRGSTISRAPGAREAGRLPPRDQDRVRRLLAGDEAAFVELVRTYQASLIRLARVFVHDTAVAEEVVQETWLGVISGLERFEGRSALETWIYRILVNRARTRASREARSVGFADLGLDAEDVEVAVEPDRFTRSGTWARPPARWDVDTPEKILLREETMASIERALEELPERQRLVITLRDVEGLDAPAACSILEISETHQRVLLHRARSKVRAALERYLDRK